MMIVTSTPDIAEIVAAQRAEQGLPPRVCDPAALRTIAQLVAKGGRK